MDIIVNIISVQEFYSKKNNCNFYRCYIAMEDGSIASMISSDGYRTGDEARLVLATNRDGGLSVRLAKG